MPMYVAAGYVAYLVRHLVFLWKTKLYQSTSIVIYYSSVLLIDVKNL